MENHLNIKFITNFIKLAFINFCTFYMFLRIINFNEKLNLKLVILTILTLIISYIALIIKHISNSLYSIIFLIMSLSLLYSFITKNKIGYTLLVTTILLATNYFLFLVSVSISFFFNLIFRFSNEYIQLLLIIIVNIVVLHFVLNIKKFKYGIEFLQRNHQNEYLDILILNISVIMLLIFLMLPNIGNIPTRNLFAMISIFGVILIITIQKAFTMYYKHKLLVKELEDTKKELEDKNKEISELEKENLNFSKVSHSIAHKQEVLEYKLNQLSLNSEIAEELDISDKLKEISDEYSNITSNVSLSKTGVESIDNMLELQQAKCIKDHIDFDLKLSGSIHHMINNSIDKGDLEILLADHIKNAIIAINNSDNINRSILVKLGMIDKYYSLVIYDSGIEFKIDTLMNLGITPSSTHLDDGGTGMGFMNTFDTLNKTNGSIYIDEIGKISKDNYTKSISIIFDNKHEYHISSYRSDEIKANVNREDLIIE